MMGLSETSDESVVPVRPSEFSTDQEWAYALWDRVAELEDELAEAMVVVEATSRALDTWRATREERDG
jgi:hypothetical protein